MIIFILLIIIVLLLCSCSKGVNNDEKNDESITTTKEQMKDETTTKETVMDGQMDDTSSYRPNGITLQPIIDVLVNDAEFTWVQKDCNEEEKQLSSRQMKLSEYSYKGGTFYKKPVELGFYRVIDLDGDGYNEVILDIPSSDAIIFHYEEGEVYGYAVVWAVVQNVTISGVCMSSGGASYGLDYKISFDGDTYTEIEVALLDGDKYYLNSREATESEYYEYVQNRNDDGYVPYWSDFESLLK